MRVIKSKLCLWDFFPYPAPYLKWGGPKNTKNKWEKWKLWGKQQRWALSCTVLGKGITALVTLEYQPVCSLPFLLEFVSWKNIKAPPYNSSKQCVGEEEEKFPWKCSLWLGWEVITWSPQGGSIFFLPPFRATKRLKQGFLSLGCLDSVLLLTIWGLCSSVPSTCRQNSTSHVQFNYEFCFTLARLSGFWVNDLESLHHAAVLLWSTLSNLFFLVFRTFIEKWLKCACPLKFLQKVDSFK